MRHKIIAQFEKLKKPVITGEIARKNKIGISNRNYLTFIDFDLA